MQLRYIIDCLVINNGILSLSDEEFAVPRENIELNESKQSYLLNPQVVEDKYFSRTL